MPSIRFEITNKCNLLCPSCQEGRINFAKTHDKFMYANTELCEKIFKRLYEHNEKFDIYLYMFCEPCLHPQLNEVLDIMDSYGLSAYISSNLNVKQDWKKLLSHSSLKRLTISISGITQNIYERGHRGGRIDLVLKNMECIAELAPRSNTEILVFFHQYNDNANDESQLRCLCDKYGFTFVPSPAFFMYSPWMAQKHFAGELNSSLMDGLNNTLPRLLVEQNFFMESIPSLSEIPCSMELAKDITIDCQGYVHQGCCLETLTNENKVGSFLDMSFEEINTIYKTSTLCKSCKKNGYHVQFSLTPHVEYTRMAKMRTLNHDNKSINTSIRSFILRKNPLKLLKNTPIHIYGTVGNAGIITLLKAQGYTLGDCIDDNPALKNTTFCGLNIRPLTDFSTRDIAQMCIIISFIRENKAIETIKKNLINMGVRHVYALHELFFLNDSENCDA